MTASAKKSLVMSSEEKGRILHNCLANDQLELIIFPTEKCNFRCTYCYEDFLIGRMRQEIRLGIKNLIAARSPDLKLLNLSWFGGEPLQAFDVIDEIGSFAKDIAVKSEFELAMHITTNAYRLSRERVLRLCELETKSFQITLDGEENGHNKTRLRADGSGTFSQIWSNLLDIEKLYRSGAIGDCTVILRLHVHPKNIDSMMILSSMINDNFSPNIFSVMVHPISKLGGKNDKNMVIFSREEVAYNVNIIKTALSRFISQSNDSTYVCYATKANSFAIRADGRIAKCTVALNSEHNTIGYITENGILDIDPRKFNAWLEPLSTMNPADLGCPVNLVMRNAKASLESV